MRRSLIGLLLFFVGTARGQTGVISLTVTSTPVSITVNQPCNYVVVEENSSTPTNAFTITLPGGSTGINYPIGAKFVFSSATSGFKAGQTIGSIAVAGGSVSFVGIESATAPTLPASTGGSGSGGVITVDGVPVPNANLQDSNTTNYQVIGNNIQLNTSTNMVSPPQVANGNFDLDNFFAIAAPLNPPIGWDTLGCDTGILSWDTVNPAPNKTFSLKIQWHANCVEAAMPNQQLISVIPGETVTLTGYVRSDGTAPAALCLEFEQGGGSVINDSTTCQFSTSTSWIFLTVTGTAVSGQDYLFIDIANTNQNTVLDSPVAGTAWYDDIQINVNSIPGGIVTSSLKSTGTTFASLGTPTNGTLIYCSDCTIASTCAGSGTGAFAKRLNGSWICN